MKIEFHYTYVITALGFIITGYFSNLIIFTSIILIHELGHYTIAKLTNINPKKIIIYPFGGITKTNGLLNIKIEKELLVAISGLIFQTIYFLIILLLYKFGLIREYIFNIYKTYHYNIFYFNVLPIYPLDGMIILSLIISKFLPYKKTMKLSIIISIITGLIVFVKKHYIYNYTNILIIGIIVNCLIKYSKNINYLFNRFLLERHLYKFRFNKIKKIKKIDDFYKDRYHIIKENNIYLTEKQLLLRCFKRNS